MLVQTVITIAGQWPGEERGKYKASRRSQFYKVTVKGAAAVRAGSGASRRCDIIDGEVKAALLA